MKSLILYGSRVKLSNAHKLVTSPNTTFPQPEYYVRATVFNGGIDAALNAAHNPGWIEEGEIVLNTVPVD